MAHLTHWCFSRKAFKRYQTSLIYWLHLGQKHTWHLPKWSQCLPKGARESSLEGWSKDVPQKKHANGVVRWKNVLKKQFGPKFISSGLPGFLVASHNLTHPTSSFRCLRQHTLELQHGFLHITTGTWLLSGLVDKWVAWIAWLVACLGCLPGCWVGGLVGCLVGLLVCLVGWLVAWLV